MKIKHTGAPFTSVFRSTRYKAKIEFVTTGRPLKEEELARYGRKHESELAGKPVGTVIEKNLGHLT
jgi:hypothetical protein